MPPKLYVFYRISLLRVCFFRPVSTSGLECQSSPYVVIVSSVGGCVDSGDHFVRASLLYSSLCELVCTTSTAKFALIHNVSLIFMHRSHGPSGGQ